MNSPDARTMSPEKRARVVRALAEQPPIPHSALAERFGTAISTIALIAREEREGVTPKQPKSRKQEIERLLAAGGSPTEVARELGVSQGWVRQVKSAMGLIGCGGLP